MHGLRSERSRLRDAEVIYGESAFPPSMVLIAAIVLLLIGAAAILNMLFQVGPF